MTIDKVLVKYTGMYEELRGHLATIEAGEIPHSNEEGAPETLGEAAQAILGMSFIVNMVLNDLLEMQMEEVFTEADS